MTLFRTLVISATALAFLAACSTSGPRRSNPIDTYPRVERPDTGEEVSEIPYPKESVPQLFKRAANEIKKKDFDFAKVTLKQVTLREPWNLKAHEMYQDILFTQDRYTSAYHEFFDMLAEDQESARKLYLFARVVLAKRKNTEIQTQELDAATRSKSESLMTQAQASVAEGKRSEAIAHLNALTELVPEHIAGHRLLQDLELAQADQDKVQAKVKELVTRYQELALEHEVNGDMVYCYERVASLQAPEDESRVQSTLRYMRAVAQDLQGYWLYYGFARAASERAAFADDEHDKVAMLKLSEMLYKVVTASDELIAEGWYGLGLVQQAQGNLKGANAALEFAIDLDGMRDSELIVAYGKVLERLNKNAEAKALYKDAAERFPNDFRFIYSQGRVAFVEGEKAIAIGFFERTLAMIGDTYPDFSARIRKTIAELKK